jgi:hypothetical protein
MLIVGDPTSLALLAARFARSFVESRDQTFQALRVDGRLRIVNDGFKHTQARVPI